MQHTITFTQQVKEEIASNTYESKDRLRALLAAFIKINGTLTFKNKETIYLSNEIVRLANEYMNNTLKQ